MFEVVGTFQAKRLLSDARAQMNIMNAIMLNGMVGVFQAVDQVTQQVQGLVDATVPLAQEFAEARIQFDKFMGESENLDQVRKEVIDIGLAFGFTANEALKAGAKMAQLKDVIGGEGSVTAATEVGIKFALIGDMETQDAMQKMVNLQQQTNFMFSKMSSAQIEAMTAEQKANLVRKNSMDMLTQLNTVENRSAATMQQLTFVMNQFASQAHMTGESIADMAANAAVLIESGEEMGKAGRALRMIYARLGSNTQDNNDLLASYGVQVKNTAGELRPLSDIIADLAQSYPEMTKAQQQQVAQLVAGNDHYVRFLKLVAGAERQQTLSTQAALGLADAQDEVNLKLEDQAIELKKLQAELKNTEALLGNAFIPAEMKATKQQVSFNKAIHDFYTEADLLTNPLGSVIKAGMDMAFHFQRVQKVLGPVVEAMLNLKSLSVAMETQRTIMRAMQGEQLVNQSMYQAANISQKHTNDLVHQEFQARQRLTHLAETMLFLSKETRDINEQELLLVHAQMGERNAINQLEAQKHVLLKSQTGIETTLMSAIAKSRADKEGMVQAAQAHAAVNNVLSLQEEERLKINLIQRQAALQQSESLLQAENNRHALFMSKILPGETKVFNVKAMGFELALQAAQLDNLSETVQKQIVSGKLDEVELTRESVALVKLEQRIRKIMKDEQIDMQKSTITQMAQRLLQSQALNQSMMTYADLQLQINILDTDQSLILEGLVNKKMVNNEISEYEMQIIQAMIPLMDRYNVTTLEQAQRLYQKVQASVQAAESDRQLAAAAGVTQAAMMKMSAGLGAASGIITLFDDSAKGAKISMALMTPVMLISTIQMIQMTNAMMAQSTQSKELTTTKNAEGMAWWFSKAGIDAAKVSLVGFMAAAWPMLAVTVVLTAAMYLFMDSTSAATEATIEMNDAVTDSLSILSQLENIGLEESLEGVPEAITSAFEAAGIDPNNILSQDAGQLKETIDVVRAAMDDLAIKAGDGATMQERIYQSQLDAANKYVGALQTQETFLIAQLVLAGEISAANEKMAESSTANAESSLDQFMENHGDDWEAGWWSGASGDWVEQANADGKAASAALITGFQSEMGDNFTSAEVEDFLEVLSHYREDQGGWNEVIRDSGKNVQEFNQYLKQFDQEALKQIGHSLDDTGDFNTDDAETIKKMVDKLETSFEMTTEDAQLLVDVIAGLGSGSAADAVGDAATEVEHLGEAIGEFNNNREAMFFGLSQSGFTGEFVKQVKNQGVENLIANTELIVNNTFNGMSLPEMVEEVTDGVVERLVAAGVVEVGAY